MSSTAKKIRRLLDVTYPGVQAVVNEDLRRLAGLERLYPFREENIKGCTAYADPFSQYVVLSENVTAYESRGIMAVYLHEVAHLIAAAENIEDEPTGRTHNRYFACLVAVMYRRLGILDRLTTYDIGDTYDRQAWGDLPPDTELLSRYRYAILRSAELAPLPLSVEAIARKLRKDADGAWEEHAQRTNDSSATRDFVQWGLGFVVGVMTTGAALFLTWAP